MTDYQQEEISMGVYGTMAKGDRAIELIRSFCIILIGLTRVGKSTVHNWLNMVPMVGRRNQFGNIHYQAVSSANHSQMSPHPTSKTLIPNIKEVNQDTCIIDPAGFKDRRNHVGVFTVNFMLKVIFEKAQNFKFAIVISRQQIDLQKDIMDTLFYFINLFDFQNLNQAVKQSLLESIGLIVTRAGPIGQDAIIETKLRGILEGCSRPAFRYSRKKACLQVLKRLLDTHRIGYFRQADIDKNSPPEDVMEMFNLRNWTYFPYSELKKTNQKIVINSFDKDYDDMTRMDRQNYEEAIKNKISAYGTAMKIIGNFIRRAMDQFHVKNINYEDMFAAIDQFNDQFDQYSDEDKAIPNRLKATGLELKLIQQNDVVVHPTMEVINQILSFGRDIAKITYSEPSDSLAQRMAFLRSVMKDILTILLQLCCRNRKEEIKIINFAYILLRGFRQFTIISEIDNRHCDDADLRIKDHINGIYDEEVDATKHKIITKVSNLSYTEKQDLFTNTDELRQYLEFFSDFMTDYGHKYPNFSQLMKIKNQQKLLYCQYVMEQGKKNEAKNIIVKIVEELIENKRIIVSQYSNNTLDMSEVDRESLDLEDSFRSAFLMMGKILLSLKHYNLANRVFSEIQEVAFVCETFQKLLLSLKSEEQIQSCSQEFSRYCSTHGRVEQSILILQQFSKRVKSTKQAADIRKRINLILKQKEHYYESYCSLNEMESSFLRKEDQNLEQLLEQIKGANSSDNSINKSFATDSQ